MEDGQILKTLQNMAWERAKGELNHILFIKYALEDKSRKFRDLKQKINRFIDEIECHYLDKL